MGGSIWTEPSPSDWERWEARLELGEEPATAAKTEGQTCSAFKRSDPVRHAAALERGRVARGWIADERVEGWALKDDASDSMRQFWAKRWQPLYGTGRVEISGPDGGPLEVEVDHEPRAVLDKLERFGLLPAGTAGALDAAAAGEILPAPAD